MVIWFLTVKTSLTTKLFGWVRLSRPPFHLVGILPFLLGTLLAWNLEGVCRPSVCGLGIGAVVLIMLSTYQAGEYFDWREDTISRRLHKSRFAGGSGVIQQGILPHHVPRWTSIASIIVAAIIGIILQFGLHTGPYTLVLGALGLLGGFFYSTPPVRLVEKGIGELAIGFCYGWLPVAAAYYIQTGYIHPVIHWISVPIACTIINVILLNEFLDYEADKATGKKNLLVRTGIEGGTYIYSAMAVISWFFMFFSLTAGVPLKALYLYIPVILVSAGIVVGILLGKHRNFQSLEVLCGLNIVVNLGTTVSYIVAFI